MQLKNNIPELIERLESIKASLGGGAGNPPAIPDFSDAMFGAINTGMGLMKRRIFNLGEDAEGGRIGRYVGNKSRITDRKLSIAQENPFDEKDRKKRRGALNRFNKNNDDRFITEYEKLRVSHGRQIEYKDLELTGSLRNSIETVRADNGKVVIAITNPETALIAGYQEMQVGEIRGGGIAKIFTLSQAEYEQVQVEGNRSIHEVIKGLFS